LYKLPSDNGTKFHGARNNFRKLLVKYFSLEGFHRINIKISNNSSKNTLKPIPNPPHSP
jgi:hypothetical protein